MTVNRKHKPITTFIMVPILVWFVSMLTFYRCMLIKKILKKWRFWSDGDTPWKDISLKTTNISLMVMLEESHWSPSHPLGIMNVCAEFHDNPSNSYWDISAWTNQPTVNQHIGPRASSLKLWTIGDVCLGACVSFFLAPGTKANVKPRAKLQTICS